jgi:hypothetical protein
LDFAKSPSGRVPIQPNTDEVWSGNKGEEYVMFWGTDSPTVSDRLANHLGLDPSQRKAMNQAFQTYFHEFRTLEDQNTQHETDANGHQITTIAALRQQLPKLEERFWSELDSALDGRQLTLGRKVVWLRAGMFEASDYNYRVEIWRVGQIHPWYHWRESYPGRANVTPSSEIDPSSGPELPETLRRFWREPTADEGTIERVPSTPSPTPDQVRMERIGHLPVVGDDPFLSLAVQGQFAYLIQTEAPARGRSRRSFTTADCRIDSRHGPGDASRRVGKSRCRAGRAEAPRVRCFEAH